MHLKDTPQVKVGQILEPGDHFGFVGTTGNSTGPHCHYDIFKEKPYKWTLYPTDKWTVEEVRKVFLDPTPIIANTQLPAPNTLPKNGSQFLQWNGSCYHPGVDINSTNDDGKPLRSPVYGRVVYVGTLLERLYSGLGNFLVIEEITHAQPDIDLSLARRLAGRFLLATEARGRLWWVDQNGRRYDVGISAEEAAAFLRTISNLKIPLGISNQDLAKIPKG